MSGPEVSVVMPLYDQGGHVAGAVASVLAQTRGDCELIVVDDGSTDDGPRVVAGVGDPRVVLLRQDHAGVAAARNRGVRAARADLVAFLDADDRWERDFLETVLDLRAAHPECAVFATGYVVALAGGASRPAAVRGLAAGFTEGVLRDYFAVAAAGAPPLWTGAVAVRTAALREIGGFPQGVASGEDLLTWARLASRHAVAYSRAPKATFNGPASAADRPQRAPAEPDVVGAGLQALLAEVQGPRARSLRRYLGHWRRMRGVVYLQRGDLGRARRELVASLRCGFSAKVALLAALTLLGARGAPAAFHALRRAGGGG